MMKKFIFKVLIFTLPVLIIAIGMELLLRSTPNDYSYKKEYLDQNSNQIETFVLGSSHSFYGVDPSYFSTKTFNASQISQSLKYDFEILKKYQGQFKSLKTVILPISYFTLFSTLETSAEAWRVKNYMIYYDLNSSESLADYSEVLSNRLDVVVKKLVADYVNGDRTIFCSELGWGTSYKSKNAQDLLKTGESASKRHSVDMNLREMKVLFDENISLLKSIIKWGKARNINIIFFTPPSYKTYSDRLNTQQLKITIDIVRETCSRFDNCVYINFLSDTVFVKSDYYDADHLSEIGAKKLSEILDQMISELYSSTFK